MREKARLTAEFLSQSLSLFRQAQQDYTRIFEQCEANGWRRIVFYGQSDLTSVAALFVQSFDLQVCAIIDDKCLETIAYELPVFNSRKGLVGIDAYVITDLQNPQPVYDRLVKDISVDRVLTPNLLDLMQANPIKVSG